jgi:predicted SAM-dependent methyltransferase
VADTSFDPAAHPDRINIGCGWDHRDGYLNVDFQDFHKPDLLADVRDLSMLPSDHYVEVIAQDVLEHLERDEIDPALNEWARLLKVGGTLVVRVPDIMGVARLIAKLPTIEHHHAMVHAILGTQAYTGDYHHASFTELTLRHSLHQAGFEVTELRQEREWMIDCVATKVDDPGVFDPGPLPLLDLCPHRADVTRGADTLVSSVAAKLPESVRRSGQRVWRPLRTRLAQRGLI